VIEKQGVVAVTELRPLSPKERKGLAAEVRRLEEFLGATSTLG